MTTQLAHIVRSRRLRMGRTQKAVSRKAGVSEHWMHNLEGGAVFSLFIRLHNLSHVLRLPAIQILEAAWFDATGERLRGNGVQKFIPKIEGDR